jgi:hypothetical protein
VCSFGSVMEAAGQRDGDVISAALLSLKADQAISCVVAAMPYNARCYIWPRAPTPACSD